jgi:hypothetical protein
VEPTPLQRALVAWRLLAVSSTVLALGSGAHVLAGGHAPSAGVVALLGALVLLAAAALARRPLTVRVLLPVAVAAQVGVHLALTWLGSGGDALRAAGGAHGPHGTPVPGAGAGAGAEPAAAATHAGASGLLMPAAHALAMAATVLLLVATERGLLALVRRWSALLPALGDGVAAPVRPARRPAPPVVRPRRHLRVLAGSVVRRGPPVVQRPCATA